MNGEASPFAYLDTEGSPVGSTCASLRKRTHVRCVRNYTYAIPALEQHPPPRGRARSSTSRLLWRCSPACDPRRDGERPPEARSSPPAGGSRGVPARPPPPDLDRSSGHRSALRRYSSRVRQVRRVDDPMGRYPTDGTSAPTAVHAESGVREPEHDQPLLDPTAPPRFAIHRTANPPDERMRNESTLGQSPEMCRQDQERRPHR
jgi:hypothetical protein